MPSLFILLLFLLPFPCYFISLYTLHFFIVHFILLTLYCYFSRYSICAAVRAPGISIIDHYLVSIEVTRIYSSHRNTARGLRGTYKTATLLPFQCHHIAFRYHFTAILLPLFCIYLFFIHLFLFFFTFFSLDA